MKVMCVDDEELILDMIRTMCADMADVDETEGFTSPEEALEWLEDNEPDIALLDIDIPGMDGIMLAKAIKDKHPGTAIIFVTGYSQYAVDAFSMHASGYLLKPISRDRLEQEMEYAIESRGMARRSHIMMRTFGNFDLLVDGNTVAFSRSKSKELLAYLVDKQGSSVTRAEAFAVLWENGVYNRSMQKQLDVIIRSLKTTLHENGISEILEMKSGSLRIKPELVDCDLYRFIQGDPDAVNSYTGEYMNAYSWASLTEAYMDRRIKELGD